MANNGVPNPNFKGFVANIIQANWNVVWIVYGNGDLNELMVDRENFFSLESIRANTQNNISNQSCEKKHRIVCYEYKNAIFLGEVDAQYAIIHCWWYSSDATDELGVYELENWLNFWHFCVRMGRIMIHVLFSTRPHIFSFTPPFWQVHIYGIFHFKIAYQTFFSYRNILPKNLQTCPHVTFQRQTQGIVSTM